MTICKRINGKRLTTSTFDLAEASLEDDANFIVDGESEFVSLYLQGILDDDLNSGVRHEKDKTTRSMPSSSKDNGNMHTNERPEDNDDEAVDKYLNVELIINMGTNDE